MSAPSAPDKALAHALRSLRTLRGLTQEDLAHAARLTVAAYARIERGHANPTWTTVRRLARALKTDLESLGALIEDQDEQGAGGERVPEDTIRRYREGA